MSLFSHRPHNRISWTALLVSMPVAALGFGCSQQSSSPQNITTASLPKSEARETLPASESADFGEGHALAIESQQSGEQNSRAASRVITVAPGDTLYGLAQRHQVSIATLAETNHLASMTLKAGQRLVLPPYAR